MRYPVTAQGSRYSREQAINCTSGERVLVVEFSSAPSNLDPVVARNLIRFTPAVPDLTFSQEGRTLEIKGGFRWDTLYTVALVPTDLVDQNGRKLEMKGKRSFPFLSPQARLRQMGSEPGNCGTLRKQERSGGRARAGTCRPAHSRDRSPGPLVLAFSRSAGRSGRIPAASGTGRRAVKARSGNPRQSG